MATELITLADLNQSLSTDLKSFFGIEFKDASTMIVPAGLKQYEYNRQAKQERKPLYFLKRRKPNL
jgi:dipeptidyl-peptidase-4